MMPQQPEDPRVGTDIAGYRVQERIGRGGMGHVYLAEHLTLKRQAAIKIISPELAEDSGFRERFLREARIAAGLVHPNVVTVYDAGEIGNDLYIAMQYVPGSDLAVVLRAEGRLGPYRALDVGRQVAAALDAAHAMNLIHRDVKPANVLMDGRHAYLTDFGLAKERMQSRAGLTRSGEVVGTTHYLAPEQVEGGPVDGRADIYALACMLFHCLTGEVPYPRDSDMAVMYAHVHDPPPSLLERRPGLPPALDSVFSKAFDKSPGRRFTSCDDFIAAARTVVDAHGPLSESSASRRPVPPGGDGSDIKTSSFPRPVPAGGDPSSVHTLTGIMGPGRRPIVLLAGLDAGSRAIAHVALDGRCEVVEAADAEGAVSMAKEKRPDVVLVAAASKTAPPSTVSAAVRDDPVTRDAKVVLLAGSREAGKREAAAVGADESLATPFSPLQLQVKLRKLLGK
jgi:serine/threonine protein kinase/CheY-like chemotaxis protein